MALGTHSGKDATLRKRGDIASHWSRASSAEAASFLIQVIAGADASGDAGRFGVGIGQRTVLLALDASYDGVPKGTAQVR